jgi:hypothetical protein
MYSICLWLYALHIQYIHVLECPNCASVCTQIFSMNSAYSLSTCVKCFWACMKIWRSKWMICMHICICACTRTVTCTVYTSIVACLLMPKFSWNIVASLAVYSICLWSDALMPPPWCTTQLSGQSPASCLHPLRVDLQKQYWAEILFNLNEPVQYCNKW